MAMISAETRFHPPLPLAAVFRVISRSIAVRRQRRHLGTLDDTRLDDLGLSYKEARREACRPVWNVPGHWLRATY